MVTPPSIEGITAAVSETPPILLEANIEMVAARRAPPL